MTMTVAGGSLLDYALGALALGLCVVPPRQDGSKAPIGRWEQYQHERPSEDEVRRWYANDARTGFGVVCGAVSGGLVMLELEGRAVADGLHERLDELAAQRGLSDLLARVSTGYWEWTPSGGLHVLYRCATPVGNEKLARRRGADGKIEVLVETRGEGGYVILAPSHGTVHQSGAAWIIELGSLAEIATITDEEQAALLDLCRALDELPVAEEVPVSPVGKPMIQQVGRVVPVGADDRPGDEFDRSCDEVLVEHGFEHHHSDAKGSHWTRPGKDRRQGSSATVWADNGRCTLFSSSIDAQPEVLGDRNLSAWQLHAALRYPTLPMRAAVTEAAREWRSAHPRAQAATQRPSGVDPETGELAAHFLPLSFYESRPELAHIRRFAHASMSPADAVFAAVLARVSALTPHRIVGPAIIGEPFSLNFFVAVVGASGAGKSSSASRARRLLPGDALGELDGIPAGSGEGLIDAFFGLVEETLGDGKKRKVKRQVHHQALVHIDEGSVLAELGARTGSTLLSTLRTAWTGATAGQQNASSETRRRLPEGSYRLSVLASFQPEVTKALMADQVAGTPQRFLWLSATDPSIPDELPTSPGRLEWVPPVPRSLGGSTFPMGVTRAIAREVQDDARARARGEVEASPLDSHRNLMRLKVAALLAVLAGRLDIEDADWDLAGVVLRTSDAVRASMLAAIRIDEVGREVAHQGKLAARQAAVEEVVARKALERAARVVARHVHLAKCEGGCSRRCATQAIAGRDRALVSVEEALDHAASLQWVVFDGAAIRPGKARPT